MTRDPIRCVIVDDDALALKRIRQVLKEEDDVTVVAEASDGNEAVTAIRRHDPDLVLLDVQMPGLDGFGVVAEIGSDAMPPVVFVSAFEEFAIRAFEAYALDYVLKPYDDERLRAAIERFREHRPAFPPDLVDRLDELMRFVAKETAEYPEALAIKTGDRYTLVEVELIGHIEAEGNSARLHMGEEDRLISKSLAELERHVLDPRRFLRIHRSTIVNLSRIDSVEPLFHGELSVRLRDGTKLTCSRRHRKRLQERIYFTH